MLRCSTLAALAWADFANKATGSIFPTDFTAFWLVEFRHYFVETMLKIWRCLFCTLALHSSLAWYHVNFSGSAPDFGLRNLSQRLWNSRAMLVGGFSRLGDHSRPISGRFGDFGPNPLSETSTSVLSQQQTSVLSQQQTSVLSQPVLARTGKLINVRH